MARVHRFRSLLHSSGILRRYPLYKAEEDWQGCQLRASLPTKKKILLKTSWKIKQNPASNHRPGSMPSSRCGLCESLSSVSSDFPVYPWMEAQPPTGPQKGWVRGAPESCRAPELPGQKPAHNPHGSPGPEPHVPRLGSGLTGRPAHRVLGPQAEGARR